MGKCGARIAAAVSRFSSTVRSGVEGLVLRDQCDIGLEVVVLDVEVDAVKINTAAAGA